MKLLPAKLKSVGYSTAVIGKWHLGARSARNLPVNRGFDYHFGFLGGGEHHLTQKAYAPDCVNYVDLWEDGEGVELPGPAYGQDGHNSCDLYSAKALAQIEKHDQNAPLFLYMAFHDVHAPYECPDQYVDPTLAGTPPARKSKGCCLVCR